MLKSPIFPYKTESLHFRGGLATKDHMPGTHWLHPHRHGSTALQVGGGAASALIVEDPPGTLPSEVEGAPEVILMVTGSWLKIMFMNT